jgi:hypothetical protein
MVSCACTMLVDVSPISSGPPPLVEELDVVAKCYRYALPGRVCGSDQYKAVAILSVT